MSFDLAQLTAAVDRFGPVVRVVITASAGSVPRGAGTSMLVWAAGSEGTIGGGALEHQAMERARAMLGQGPRAQARTLPLGPDLGQCCGGQVSLVWEVFDTATLPKTLPFARPVGASGRMPDRVKRLPDHHAPVLADGWLVESAPAHGHPLWVWGAGHVGRALVGVMSGLPDWQITWVDTGADRFPQTIPAGVETLPATDLALLATHAPLGAEHIVLTYSHTLDLMLCDTLLRRGFGGLGLIGSATKWARFTRRLAAMGHAPGEIAKITCPIGDPALGKHPAAIALGVATSLQRQAMMTKQKGMVTDARDTA